MYLSFGHRLIRWHRHGMGYERVLMASGLGENSTLFVTIKNLHSPRTNPTMPLAPIGENPYSTGASTSTSRRRRERNSSKEQRSVIGVDNDGSADDILSLLESTLPEDNVNNNIGKQSAMRDQKYGNHASRRRSSTAPKHGTGIGTRSHNTGSSREQQDAKKVRFAGGDILPDKLDPSAGNSSTAPASFRLSAGSASESINTSTTSMPRSSYSALEDIRIRATKPSSNDSDNRSTYITRGSDESSESLADRKSGLQVHTARKELSIPAGLESKTRHEEQMQILQRRHEEEREQIVAEDYSNMDRANNREVDAAAMLSRLVGPISESTELLQKLNDEWLESKPLTERESSRFAAEIEKQLATTQETRKEEVALLKDAVSTLQTVSNNLKSRSLKEREQLDAERCRLELLQVRTM